MARHNMNPYEGSEQPQHGRKIKRRDRNKTVNNTAKVYSSIKMSPSCRISDVIRDTNLPETNVRRYVRNLKAIGCVKELNNRRIMVDGYPPPDLSGGREILIDKDDIGSYLAKGYELEETMEGKAVLAKPRWVADMIRMFIENLSIINIGEAQIYSSQFGISAPYNGEDLPIEADNRFPTLKECLNPSVLAQWKQFKEDVKKRRNINILRQQFDQIKLQLQNAYSLLNDDRPS